MGTTGICIINNPDISSGFHDCVLILAGYQAFLRLDFAIIFYHSFR